MKGTVYKCGVCSKIFGTSFEADGLSCPYCGEFIIPIADVIDRNQYIALSSNKDKKENVKRRIQVKCIKKIGRYNIGDVFRAEVINHNEIKLDNGEVYPSKYFIDTWTNSTP